MYVRLLAGHARNSGINNELPIGVSDHLAVQAGDRFPTSTPMAFDPGDGQRDGSPTVFLVDPIHR